MGRSCACTFSVLPDAVSALNVFCGCAALGERIAFVVLPYFNVSSLLPTLLTNPSFFWDDMSTDGFEIFEDANDVAAVSGFTPVPCGTAAGFTLKPTPGCCGTP
jgi:hypothetical protein